MRIGYVTAEWDTGPGSGGIGTYTRQLAQGMCERGHEVVVFTSGSGGAGLNIPREHGSEPGPRVIRVAVPSTRWARVRRPWLDAASARCDAYAKRVAVAVTAEHRRRPFDVVEASLWNAEMSQVPAAVPLVTRLVTPVFRSTRIAGARPRLGLQRREARQVAASRLVLAISDAVGTDVMQHYGLSQVTVRRSPLGIVVPPTAPPTAEGILRLLFVGRLERRKGVDLLLQALPELLDAVPGLEVDLVGRDCGQSPVGSYAAYANQILTPGQCARVRFHGYLEPTELEQAYARCSVFVAPSRYESFGLIYLEAMSHGKPVVGCAVGGVPEVVDEEVGALVPPDDVEALSGALLRLLTDPDERRRKGARARARVLSRFTVDVMVARTEALYVEAIG